MGRYLKMAINNMALKAVRQVAYGELLPVLLCWGNHMHEETTALSVFL